jgi:hypothetical protein
MKTSAKQLRALHRSLSRHRMRVALIVALSLFMGWFVSRILRDPFREDVFNRIQLGMAFTDVQGLMERSGCSVDRTSGYEIFMGSRHTFFSRNRMLSVDLSLDGRVVGKDYNVRPGQTDFWAAIRRWIADAFRWLRM